jgi:DNA polymerase III subunit delta
MKIRLDQLKQHCNPVSPLYIISGDETLLVQEASSMIRQSANKQGYAQRDILNVDTSFDWSAFHANTDNLSLFADKKLIELRFLKKPDAKAQKALAHYLKYPNENNLLLITVPKLDASAQRTQWFKALAQAGTHIPIWPIDAQQLPRWIKQRAQQFKLTLSDQAIQAICDQVEGNLLAAHQTLEKLSLTVGTGTIDDETVIAALSEHSRYDVFALTEACTAQQTAQIVKILASLKGEGIDPILILWAIHREMQLLLNIMDAISQGLSMDAAMNQQRLWDKRKQTLTRFLRTCKRKQLYQCLKSAAKIDRCVKGVEPGNAWDALLQLCLLFSGALPLAA